METDGNYVYSGFRAHYTITAVSQEGEYMVIMKTAGPLFKCQDAHS